MAASRAHFLKVAVVWALSSVALVLPAVAEATNEEAKSGWPAISPEELALKDDPANPGASAMILYRDEAIDDMGRVERHYTRIKIFTDEGKENADIEIPYQEKAYDVEDIQARTIHPDGTAVVFEGQVFDRVVVKAKRLRFQAKALTLPDVQRGCIIEYSYDVHWREKSSDVLRNLRSYLIQRAFSYPTAHWRVQEDLFTRRAHFSFRPLPGAALTWTWKGLPPGKQPEKKPDGTVQMEIENVAPYETEDHMPPEEMVRARVDFFYTGGFSTAEGFWAGQGRLMGEGLQRFIGNSKLVRRTADELIAANDSPEAKLRKIYARVQQVRYLSYEPSKTVKEEKRENIKEVKSAEDVLKRGYASGNEINLLFVALTRASGFESFPVMVADRRQYFFQEEVPDPDPRQLHAMVVSVKVGNSAAYFDPAARFCPFRLLPWFESGTRGVTVRESAGALVSTPEPKSTEAVTERNGKLELDRDRNLKGKIQVNFVGQEALDRRLEYLGEDEAGRRRDLEDEIKGWLPPGATVELRKVSNWDKADESLWTEFEVTIPSFADVTRRRLLLPLAIFQGKRSYPFQTSRRVNPIYFRYPYQEEDDLTILVPPGYRVESLPQARAKVLPFGRYDISYENQAGLLHLRRHLVMDRFFFPVESYSALRVFFDSARAGDEQLVVLKSEEAVRGQ